MQNQYRKINLTLSPHNHSPTKTTTPSTTSRLSVSFDKQATDYGKRRYGSRLIKSVFGSVSADCEREIGCRSSLDRDAKGTLVGGICEGERLYKPVNTRLLDVIPEYTRSGRVRRPRDNPSAYLRREVSSSVPTRCTGVR